jgi:hypothetical protein
MQYCQGSQAGTRVFDGEFITYNEIVPYNITIDHCTGFDMISEGVWVGYGSNFIITNNEFYDGHKDSGSGYSNVDFGGILASSGVSNVIISNNYVHDIYDSGLVGLEWQTGYGNDNNPTNVSITKNLLIDNKQHVTYGGNIWLGGGDSSSIVAYNIIEVTAGNCGTNTSMGVQAAAGTAGSAAGVKVYNNTFFYACSTGQPIGANRGAYIDVENNILHNTAGNSMVWLQNNSPASTFKNNLYYGLNGTYFFGRWGSNSGTTLSTWKAASGEKNAQIANPLFINGSGSYSLATDFKLQSGSPAIHAGTNVGLTTDYAGNPVPSVPDIGAYQFVAPISPPKLLRVGKPE